MPRMPYPDVAHLPEVVRQVVTDRPSNVTKMLALASEPVFMAMTRLLVSFMSGSPLPPQLREIAVLRVGYLSNAKYELFKHEALARHIGMKDAQMTAIKAGDANAAVLGEAGVAVLAYVDDLVKNIRASDATLAEVRKHLTDTQVIDLTLVAGTYMAVCRFLETTGIEVDSEETRDWNHMISPLPST